jgi:6-phosphogluconolactonase (cycloisomerase 2 family)
MTGQLVFVQTNNPAGNQVLVYDQAADGTLTLADAVDTGGNGGRNDGGVSDPLSSQGALVYDAAHQLVLAVNAGSNTISVLGRSYDRWCLHQVLPSGGVFPVSITVRDDLVYVLNAHETGTISGYRIIDGKLHPIEGSTRSLKFTPVTGPTQSINTPAQISFTPDGQKLVITTKGLGNLIDVFAVKADGRPSESFVANPALTPVPFGFTFDDCGHLVVTEAATSTLTTYTVNPDCTVTQIASQGDGGQAMCWVTQAAGNFYTSDTASNNVTGYHIDSAGIPTVFTKADTREGPTDLVATRDETFLYVEVGTAGGIDGFRINSDGTLTLVTRVSGLNGLEGIAVA